jgi:hypothetical protein
VGFVKFNCAYCRSECDKPTGRVRRAKRRGLNLYCDRKCAGLGRRKNISKQELVERKRLYDIEYRKKNREKLKAKKAAYFQRTYDPQKAAIERKKNMHRHIEYCRRPEYKEWKRNYDRIYRAKKIYGDYWESHLAIVDIENIVRPDKYEIDLNAGRLNKAKRRKRACHNYQRKI